MAKRKCTAFELLLMVEDRLEKPALVKIQKDKELGWRPIVHPTTIDAVRVQMQADAIADMLRKRYELF